MATYFSGRRKVVSFPISVDAKNSSLTCSIYEQWEDTDYTTTSRCGDAVEFELKKLVGLSKRDIAALNAAVEGSIGAESIAQIKSKIETTIQKEVSWNVEVSTSKKLTFASPKCGRKTMFVYQLIRDYEFAFRGRRWGMTKSWDRKIRERTNIHDFMSDIEDYDVNCRCPEPQEPRKYDGMMAIDMGRVSLRAPYCKTRNGIEVYVDSTIFKIDAERAQTSLLFPVTIPSRELPARELPEIALFLGDISEDQVEASFYEYHVLEDVVHIKTDEQKDEPAMA